eukprot:5638733-Prorocentrum_lima.AAC.1
MSLGMQTRKSTLSKLSSSDAPGGIGICSPGENSNHSWCFVFSFLRRNMDPMWAASSSPSRNLHGHVCHP